MLVYKVIRKDLGKDLGYTRSIHETKDDAEAYIQYLEWKEPWATYYCEREVVLPEGYGKFWKAYADYRKK